MLKRGILAFLPCLKYQYLRLAADLLSVSLLRLKKFLFPCRQGQKSQSNDLLRLLLPTGGSPSSAGGGGGGEQGDG